MKLHYRGADAADVLYNLVAVLGSLHREVPSESWGKVKEDKNGWGAYGSDSSSTSQTRKPGTRGTPHFHSFSTTAHFMYII